MEVWKDIEGYEGLYQVSSLGRVKSLPHSVYRGSRIGYITTKERILTPTKVNGYLEVHLCRKKAYIHRLVAQAFIPNPQNLPEVNHKDEDKHNNSIDNLEWCSHRYNINYGTCVKRMSVTKSTPISQYTIDNQLVAEYTGIKEAERKTHINQSSIGKCCRGKARTAGGYIWRYKQL